MSFISKTAKKKQTTAQSPTSEQMSKCPKCGNPVYFAERITILGKDWHNSCLKCDNCDKTLTPGQHSAHLGKLYCNACYQALFGPDGFRQGVVEPRKVVLKGPAPARRDTFSKSDLKNRIKEYNLYKINPVDKLKSLKETNGQILFEGVLKLYWGLKKPITLFPGVMYNRRQSSIRGSLMDVMNVVDDEAYRIMLDEAEKEKKIRDTEKSGKKLHEIVSTGWDSQERMPRHSSENSPDDLTMSLPASGFDHNSLPSSLERRNGRAVMHRSDSEPGGGDDTDGNTFSTGGGKPLVRGNSLEPGIYNSRSPIRKRSASFRKISKQKRIEGKARSDMRHHFIPPEGSGTSVRVTSNIPTKDVILMLIAKYKVENAVSEFNLCVIHDNGVRDYLSDEDYPLLRRLKLGPNEDIAKIYIVEAIKEKEEQLSEEAAGWVKFSLTELQKFARKFEEEMEKEEKKIKERFSKWRKAVKDQLENCRTTGYHESDI